MLDEYTYVVFRIDDDSVNLLGLFPAETAGVRNVKTEELTPAEIAEAIEKEAVSGDLKQSGDGEGDESDSKKQK